MDWIHHSQGICKVGAPAHFHDGVGAGRPYLLGKARGWMGFQDNVNVIRSQDALHLLLDDLHPVSGVHLGRAEGKEHLDREGYLAGKLLHGLFLVFHCLGLVEGITLGIGLKTAHHGVVHAVCLDQILSGEGV